MANKVLSIEIGQNLTRVIEVDYKSNKPKIYKYFSFVTPEGTISEGIIGEKKADFCRFLKAGLRENNITTTKAVFAISAGSIASREVSIPMVKENKIKNVLLANSSEYFPVDLSQYQLAYRKLEQDEENKQLKLQVYAIPKTLVESYEEIAKVCNLTILAMDYVGNSVYQMMSKLAPQEFSVSVKIDEGMSLITIVKDGKVEMQRSVGYGIDGVIECISDSKIIGYKPDFEPMLTYMRRNTCIHKQLNPEETGEVPEENETLAKLRDDATEALRYLIGNISRVLDYYTSRNSDVSITKIQLLGIGAECMGLKELLSNELGMEVNTATTFDQSIPEGAPDYLTCIGAAIDPLDIASEATAKKGKESKKSSDSLVIPFVVFGVGVVVAIALMVIPLLQNYALLDEQDSLNERIEELQPAQEAYDAYNQALSEYTDAATMDELTKTPNDALLEFLSELEAKMPSNISLDNMTAGPTGVTLSLKAQKKEELGQIITEIRGFASVSSVETTGFQADQDESGNSKISCTITCTYAVKDDTVDETAGAETAGADTAGSTDGTDTAGTANTDNTAE